MAPNGHSTIAMRLDLVATIDNFLDPSERKYSIISLGNCGQVSRFRQQSNASWTPSFCILPVACSAT
jgi:hypothetical protein